MENIISPREARLKVDHVLQDWARWVYSEDRNSLRSLGIKSWLGDLVRNNTKYTRGHDEVLIPKYDKQVYCNKMVLVNTAVRSLPTLQRETIYIEYLTPFKGKRDIRKEWLAQSSRTNAAHRKLFSNVKDVLAIKIFV